MTYVSLNNWWSSYRVSIHDYSYVFGLSVIYTSTCSWQPITHGLVLYLHGILKCNERNVNWQTYQEVTKITSKTQGFVSQQFKGNHDHKEPMIVNYVTGINSECQHVGLKDAAMTFMSTRTFPLMSCVYMLHNAIAVI